MTEFPNTDPRPLRRAWDTPEPVPAQTANRPGRRERRRAVLALGVTTAIGLALVAVLVAGPGADLIPKDEAAETAMVEAAARQGDDGEADLDEIVPLATPARASAEPDTDEGARAAAIPSDEAADTARQQTNDEDDGPLMLEERLAEAETPLSGASSELAAALEGMTGGGQPQTAGQALLSAFAGGGDPDRLATASIGSQTAGDDVEVAVAESESDLLELEEIQARENEVVIASLREEGEDFGSQSRATGLSAATVTEYVNLRDAPDNESNVLTVVPANAEIEASEECPLQWCEVSFDGRQGYIFEGYVQHASR